jgi:hypothetical protein
MLYQCSRVSICAWAVAGILGLNASSTVAHADPQKGRPRTEPVSGTLAASPVNVKQRICQGEDGTYIDIRGTFAGEITSSDPRLTGELEFTAERAIVNVVTGYGTFRGQFRILDPMTGRRKAEGEFFTVITEASLNHGFAVGTLSSRRGASSGREEGESSERFLASYNATMDAALNVTGHFGDAGDPRLPAVIQTGRCSGPFLPFP